VMRFVGGDGAAHWLGGEVNEGFFGLDFEVCDGGAEEGAVRVEPSMCFHLF
jgi:hypothetical protein